MVIIGISVENKPSNSSPSDTAAPAPPPLLPEVDQLACSGDIGAEVAALCTKTASEERKIARTQRDDDMKAQEAADNAEVQTLHDKANLQLAQGITSGSLQIAQGACSSVGADQAGEVIGGAKAVTDGAFNMAITNDDASAKAQEASATAFKQMADDAHDTVQAANDFQNKVVDFYNQYVETKAQTALAATHRA